MEQNPGRIIDPFEVDQEREKWKQKFLYALVKVLRAIFYIIGILLKISLGIVKNILKTLKILPS